VTRRVCLIGDSHAAAFKLALDPFRRERDDIHFDVFASAQDSLATCHVLDGIVSPTNNLVRTNFIWTSGGKETIRLADYDDIYFIAGYSPYYIGLYIPWFPVRPTGRQLTRHIARNVMTSADPFFELTSAIAAAGARVHLVGQAFAPERSAYGAGLRADVLGDESGLAARRLEDVKAKIHDEVSAFAGRFSSLARPPPQVLDETGCFTRHVYNRNAIRLTEDMQTPYSEPDDGHANGAYGLEMLRHMFSEGRG
jgi:hypothetical protein